MSKARETVTLWRAIVRNGKVTVEERKATVGRLRFTFTDLRYGCRGSISINSVDSDTRFWGDWRRTREQAIERMLRLAREDAKEAAEILAQAVADLRAAEDFVAAEPR